MKTGATLREPVRIFRHEEGDVTSVVLERSPDRGTIEVPNDRIPGGRRPVGSRFVLVMRAVWPEPGDTAEEFFEALDDVRLEEFE
jgi:hypothetical protein